MKRSCTAVLALVFASAGGGASSSAAVAAEQRGAGDNGRSAEVSRVFAPTAPTSVVGLPTDEWVAFAVGGVGSYSAEYEFESSGPVVVTVTDAYCRGDRFELRDLGADLGLTSVPAPADDCLEQAGTLDEGLANAHFSSGRFLVGAGSHALQLMAVDSPYGGAGAGLRLTPAPVPRVAADCMRGGWARLHRSDARLFRNQGECISAVLGRS